MNSRERILIAARIGKGSELPLPELSFPAACVGNELAAFKERLESIGGECRIINSLEELYDRISPMQEDGLFVNAIPFMKGNNINECRNENAAALQDLRTVLLKGDLAVAENGAIWLPEENMGNRLLPFICERLVLLIEASCIVGHMHEAYKRIAVDRTGYGVFIAGPSKTADIEQALVIGAHGPLQLHVFILQTHKATI